jgi:signal transduction histidine kinase
LSTTKKHSILIIDDNISSIDALRSILSAEYKVYAVKDSNIALEAAERMIPDIILLDIIMPDIDGYDVVALLKESEKTKDIPVIFISGLHSANAEEKGLTLGASDYIFKPFHSGIVNQRIKNQIKLIEQINQQTLMAKISHHFLTGSHSESVFSDALRMVGVFMDIAQVLLYTVDEDTGILDCKYEWINSKYSYESYIGDKLELQEPMLTMIDGLREDENWLFGINSNDPVQKEAAKPYRRRYETFISTAIYVKDRLHAVLDLSREGNDVQWSKSEIDLAALVSGVFAGVFERDAIEHDLNVVTKLKADLLATKEHAEYLSRAKSLFLSRMSHEMLTPMNAIMGMMQLIRRRNIPENIKGYIETVDTESRHLLELINNVLDVSDMEYETFTLAESQFSWTKMIDDVLAEARRYASAKNQTLECDVDPNIPAEFIGDEMRLKLVIGNILSNAVKYTHDNGTVSFKARVLSDDSVTVILEMEITDNGIGISEEQQRALFGLFEQVDDGLTRAQGGLGIGLVLSEKIITLMGGSINVESEPDKGTRFTFTCKLFKG